MEKTTLESQALIRDIYERYANEIYKYGYFMLGNSLDAEDLVQEVFVNALRFFESFENRASPRTWLYVVARNKVMDHLRKKKAHRLVLMQLEKETVNCSSLDSTVLVMECIYKLPVNQRHVAVLRILQDISTEDTAHILEWSQARVRNTLHKAVIKLREELYEGVESSVQRNV